MHIHKQGQEYSVGDGMVGKPMKGGKRRSKVKTFKLSGRGKRNKKVYAEDKDKAVIVGYMLLVKPGRDTFSYSIDGKKYRGYRQRAIGKHPKGTKYYNYIEEA